jgi:hypothetical protein
MRLAQAPAAGETNASFHPTSCARGPSEYARLTLLRHVRWWLRTDEPVEAKETTSRHPLMTSAEASAATTPSEPNP